MRTSAENNQGGLSIDLTFLGGAVLVGVGTGLAVAAFKSSIAAVAAAAYAGDDVVMPWARRAGLGGPAVLIPAAGGFAVALLRLASPRYQLGPGLAEHVAEVERGVPLRPTAPLARSAAAVATLGTGNALGPEGPSVELGVAISRFVGTALASAEQQQEEVKGEDGATQPRRERNALRRQRELVAAGAAAGVAAGFNAPLAGVFFALEVVSEAVRAAVPTEVEEGGEGASAAASVDGAANNDLASRQDVAELDVKSSEAISATVISALVAAIVVQETIGQDLALRTPVYGESGLSLVQLPLYVGLGVLSGGVALLFREASALSRRAFNRIGAPADTASDTIAPAAADGRIPTSTLTALVGRPLLGGLACGAVGAAFPQILFFGYSTLDAILATGDPIGLDAAAGPASASSLLTESAGGLNLLSLLGAKLLATSLCVGSGLVGGTFAPSLFFGAVLGVAYQSLAGEALEHLATAIANYQTSIGVEVGSWGVIPQLSVADAPAYAMIGAAATLASVFRAPLTASVLIFELTRGYDIVLPLLAAAGTGPLVVEFAGRVSSAPAARSSAASASAATTTAPSAAKLVVTTAVDEECSLAEEASPINAATAAARATAVAVGEDEEACEPVEVAPPYVALPDECDIDNAILCEAPPPSEQERAP